MQRLFRISVPLLGAVSTGTNEEVYKKQIKIFMLSSVCHTMHYDEKIFAVILKNVSSFSQTKELSKINNNKTTQT